MVGSSPQRFVYNGATIFTEYNASWTTAQASHVLGGLDIPLMRAKAIGQGDYYHPDGMGSIVISTNEADTITGKRVYNAWGTVSTSSGSVATYGFVGREPDATGLIYLRARYYDPDTGRFTQADPLGFIDGINRYTYAKNSPVNFVDPWGTTAREPSGWIDATQNYFSNNPDELVSLGLGFTPAGVLLDLGTLLTGRDVITGEAVPWYWATLGMIPSVSEIRKASNAVNTVSEISEVAAKLPGPASGIVGDAVKGTSVLGKYPDYLNLADELGAKRFSIPTDVWNKMSRAEQWGANQKFLDRMIARGDDIVLSNPVKNIDDVSGAFRQELDYLIDKGFNLSSDGARMVR